MRQVGCSKNVLSGDLESLTTVTEPMSDVQAVSPKYLQYMSTSTNIVF